MNYLESRSDCTQKCKSSQHAYQLISLITRTDDTALLLSGLQQCWNCHKIQDIYGRSILHMASCCGRAEVIEWLISFKKVDLNLKTLENGWTSLHCAAFYGQINALVTLIKHGANLNAIDNDKFTPIEHLAVDKTKFFRNIDVSKIEEFDCYSWGSNINFTLGHHNELERQHAELVEYFKKSNISIIQIVMHKFHTLFLDTRGCVYSCGHGKDGRLGHGNEETYMLPTLIKSLENDKCVYIAASQNNSYFLLKDGAIKSCGTNEFKQLGQLGEIKSLIPKQFTMKTLKNIKIIQIECGRFHCVLLSDAYDVYTFGLNAGQLGHPKEINVTSTNIYLQEARLVKELAKLQLKFDIVACSDGATVCLDQKSKRIVYLLNDYKCKRLPIVDDVIKKIRVQGGKLDHQENIEILGADLDDSVVIVCLTVAGKLVIWKEDEQQWKQIHWHLNKQLKVKDFDLNKNGLILVTIESFCYIADFKNFKLQKQTLSQTTTTTTNQQRTRSANSNDFSYNESQQNIDIVTKIELLDLTPIPFSNRCRSVFTDPKGQNYSILQYMPYLHMHYYPRQEPSIIKNEFYNYYLENSQSSHTSTDMVINYKNKKFYFNKFILLSRCLKFFTKYNLISARDVNLGEILENKYDLKTIEMIFSLIYSGQFKQFNDVLRFNNIQNINQMTKYLQSLKELCEKLCLNDVKKEIVEELLKKLKQNDCPKNDTQLRGFIETTFNLLTNRLKLNNFNRFNLVDLYDCEIKCNRNEIIKCHKCVLIARCEYFRNMFVGFWLESNINQIALPFDYDLMKIIIDYLYTDDIVIDIPSESMIGNDFNNKAKTDKEIEILFNLYVLSDQLLLFRIKNLCEFKLSNLINLKNCIEIFNFSSNYEAKQLNDFCLEFMVNNLITLIESKYIESLNVEMLNELTKFYCNYFDFVGSRRITPYSDGIDCSAIDLIPLDLLYDQKFVDGSYFDDENLAKRKAIAAAVSSVNNRIDNSEIIMKDSSNNLSVSPSNENDKQIDNETNSLNKSDASESVKWEKVRKKNRKKINEKENDNSANLKKLVVGALFDEKDVKEYEELKNKEQNLQRPVELNKSLNKIDKPISSKNELPRSTSIDMPNKVSTNNANGTKSVSTSPWGNATIAKSPTHTLFDIINEEMTKLTVSKPKQEQNVKPQQAEPIVINSPPKGWNLSNTVQATTTTVKPKTISQIMEMEEQYIKQYHKYTNRNMDLIQLEEKAIEDLKRLYVVDDTSDMRITIELVQDTDLSILSNCTPKWKK